MKLRWLSLILMLYATVVSAQNAPVPDRKPTLTFDPKGHLILVLTPDGRKCVYNYDSNGNLTTTVSPSCGSPQSWLKSN